MYPKNILFNFDERSTVNDVYLFTTVLHPHGHWQLQELLGNQVVNTTASEYNFKRQFSTCWIL